jgi:hypothetical protein
MALIAQGPSVAPVAVMVRLYRFESRWSCQHMFRIHLLSYKLTKKT